MKQTVLRETLQVDENNQLHISIPAEMGGKVEIIIFSSDSSKQALPDDEIVMTQVVDDSGGFNNVLHSSEEDCWDDL